MGWLSHFRKSTRGTAAVEFALWLGVTTTPILGAIDIGGYAYQSMQVDMAAQAAVQSAWHNCNPTTATTNPLPAIQNCTGVTTDMQTAAQSSSLGTNVSLSTGNIVEGYYCANGSGGLTLVGSTGTAAASSNMSNGGTTTCSGVIAGSTTPPGDYISVTVTYTFHPLFGSVSVASLLGTTISKTQWLRLDG